MASFNIVDAAAGVLILMGILGGIRRGLSGELARVIAAGIALFVAWKFAEPLAGWVMQKWPMSYTRGYAAAFVGILVAALGLTWLLRAALRSMMEFAFKGRIERLGGGLCGLVRAGIVVSFLVLMISLAPESDTRAAVCERSAIGSAIVQHLRPVYDELREHQPALPLPGPAGEAVIEGTNHFVITDVENEGSNQSSVISHQ